MASDVKLFTEADVDNMWERLEYGRDGKPVVEGQAVKVKEGWWQGHPQIEQTGVGGCSEVYRWEAQGLVMKALFLRGNSAKAKRSLEKRQREEGKIAIRHELAGVKGVKRLLGWSKLRQLEYPRHRYTLLVEDAGLLTMHKDRNAFVTGEVQTQMEGDKLASIACQILGILMNSHRRVWMAHNDHSPDNYGVDSEGRASLLDWGAATSLDDDGRSTLPRAVKYKYLSPMVVVTNFEKQSNDVRPKMSPVKGKFNGFANDLWAWAVVMTELYNWRFHPSSGLHHEETTKNDLLFQVVSKALTYTMEGGIDIEGVLETPLWKEYSRNNRHKDWYQEVPTKEQSLQAACALSLSGLPIDEPGENILPGATSQEAEQEAAAAPVRPTVPFQLGQNDVVQEGDGSVMASVARVGRPGKLAKQPKDITESGKLKAGRGSKSRNVSAPVVSSERRETGVGTSTPAKKDHMTTDTKVIKRPSKSSAQAAQASPVVSANVSQGQTGRRTDSPTKQSAKGEDAMMAASSMAEENWAAIDPTQTKRKRGHDDDDDDGGSKNKGNGGSGRRVPGRSRRSKRTCVGDVSLADL